MSEETKRIADALRHVGYGISQYDINCSKCPMQEIPNGDLECGSECPTTLMTLAANLIEEMETKIPKWSSVENPPKKGGRYLILFEDGHCCDAEYDECIDDECPFGEWEAIYDSHSLGYVDSEWRAYQEVTHWMPLPEPPKEEA